MLVCNPNADFLTTVEFAASSLPQQLARSNQYFELSGEDGPSPYKHGLDQIDRAIGYLKSIRREVQDLAQHRHQWSSETGFCYICGADGNA